ncbi:MAG: hemolysin family protein [Acidobacteriota bacterium]|nr:hemolysin family protein [Acidobacteriota bacterium]
MLGLILVAALTVFISSVCSLFEATLYSTRLSTLEAAKSEGRHARLAERFIAMKTNIAQPTSAILVLNTVANTAGATVCGMYATSVLGASRVPAVSVVLTVAILFVGEILPKTFGAMHWGSLWRFIVWPLAGMQRAFKPVIKVTQGFANFFTGSHGTPVITEDEIQANIRLGRKAGELSATEQQLLNAAFHFDDMSVRQVMVPRREVAFLDASWDLAKCLAVAKETGHTRLPLLKGSLDEAVSLVHIKDLLGVAPSDDFEVKSIARPLRHVPETLPISRLMREMQRTHQHMALVDDEYGSVVGVVTLENVVEQIVGDVQDEFDSEAPEIVSEGSGAYRIRGGCLIDRVNRELGLELYSADVETISGLLAARLGRLLKAGDRVRFEGARIEVLEEERGTARLVRVRLERSGTEDD